MSGWLCASIAWAVVAIFAGEARETFLTVGALVNVGLGFVNIGLIALLRAVRA